MGRLDCFPGLCFEPGNPAHGRDEAQRNDGGPKGSGSCGQNQFLLGKVPKTEPVHCIGRVGSGFYLDRFR